MTAPTPFASAPPAPAPSPVSSAMQAWRVALVALGLVILVIAGVQLITDVAPSNYFGIAVWLVAALIIHDGIIAFAVLGASVLARRLRMPFLVFVIIQSAVVVGAIVTLLVVPEAIKKAIGSANPSILPLNYLGNLAVFLVALAVVTALAVIVTVFVTRWRAQRDRMS